MTVDASRSSAQGRCRCRQFWLAVTSGAVSVGLNGAGASAKTRCRPRRVRCRGRDRDGRRRGHRPADAGTMVGCRRSRRRPSPWRHHDPRPVAVPREHHGVSRRDGQRDRRRRLSGIRNGANVCGGVRAAAPATGRAGAPCWPSSRAVSSTSGVGASAASAAAAPFDRRGHRPQHAEQPGRGPHRGRRQPCRARRRGRRRSDGGVDGLAVAVTVGITVGDSAAITLSGAGAQVVNETAVQVAPS